MTTGIPGRHLSRSAVEEYFAAGVPAGIVVPGEPACHVLIDSPRRQMSLRTPHDGGSVDLVEFQNVDTRVVHTAGRRWHELIVDYGDHGYESYLLLSDVADMIQQDGLSYATSVRSALRTFEDLLARAAPLGPERQAGLFGELLFLESCLKDGPAEAMVEAWKGFTSHEHDFVFPGSCFEVKTTRTEKRRHRISGLHQLDPVLGSDLWLVSVQLTSAVGGAGRTLTELVDDVRAAAGTACTALDVSLAQSGWRDRDRAQYRDRLTFRSAPAAYPVDARFPVLNRRVIDQGCARPELIVDADYLIDLTSFARRNPPSPADRFVMEGS